MARATTEWRGASDDSKAPPRVRQRLYDAAKGICHICELPIKPTETWHLDHVISLIEGGENRESNLAPAHAHCNLAKANGEKARKAKVAATRQKHLGITKEGPKLQTRGFTPSPKSEKRRKKAEDMNRLPPRQIYKEASK